MLNMRKLTIVGARKMPSEFMKFSKDEAEWRIFHGTMAHPPMSVMKIDPRRMLNHLGNRLARSFAPEMTVADMFTHI